MTDKISVNTGIGQPVELAHFTSNFDVGMNLGEPFAVTPAQDGPGFYIWYRNEHGTVTAYEVQRVTQAEYAKNRRSQGWIAIQVSQPREDKSPKKLRKK